jgi:hypothetical protein
MVKTYQLGGNMITCRLKDTYAGECVRLIANGQEGTTTYMRGAYDKLHRAYPMFPPARIAPYGAAISLPAIGVARSKARSVAVLFREAAGYSWSRGSY